MKSDGRASSGGRQYAAYAGGTAVLVLVAGLALFLAGQQESVAPGDDSAQPDERGTDVAQAHGPLVTLFYVAEDGMSLVAHEQDLPITAGDDSLTRARIVMEHQLGEAPSPLASPFPPGTELRAIYITPGGDAFVDLDVDVTREHGGGSLDELFTVYALVNALTTNVPEVSAVQILVEGREVDTLAGHIDLRHPLERNMKWVSQPTAAPEPETADATEG